jgi:hypothetical protein
MRLDLGFFRCHVKARSAVNTIAIEQRHSRHLQFSAARNQALGQGRTFKKTECGAGMKFDVQSQLLAISC